jgi:hypothetical protein
MPPSGPHCAHAWNTAACRIACGDAGRVRAIAGEPDDATALARALSAAGESSGDISPAMLQHAAGRAGGMIATACARLAALPPTSSEERNRLTAE